MTCVVGGNALASRVRMGTFSYLSPMKNLYAFLFAALLFVPFAASAQCLSSWAYYQPITITNPLAQTLTNFQVKITVNTATPIAAGHMLASGDDIRFVVAGCTNVNYYIESGINTPSTVIWLKVPSIAASGNTTVDMYYGNPAAPAVANGDSVFLFFDDFNAPTFNTTKWTTRGTPSTCSQSGGILTFVGNSNWEYIRSNTTWTGPVVINTRESVAINSPSAALVLGYTGTDNRFTFRASGANKGCTYDPDVSSGNAWFDTNYPNVPHPTPGNYVDYEVQPDFVSGNIVVNRFCDQTSAACNTTSTTLNTFSGTGYYTGFSTYAAGYIEYVDYIYVRSFASQQPTTASGVEQPNAGIVTTLSSTSFCDGANVSVNFTPTGTFNAGNIFTAELSDAMGSFAVPTSIGTLNSTSTSPQTIAATIPLATPAGSQYRIRITSSNVALTGADNGTDLLINALPNVQATVYASAICNGMSDTLVASGAMTYAWSTGPTSAMIIVSPATTSSYIVTGVDVNGCSNNDTATVIVNQLPNVSAAASMVAICAGSSDQLFVGGASTYLWNTSDTASTITVMPTVTTTYTVTGTDLNGCMNTDTVSVTVNQLPVVSVSSANDTACNTDGLIALTGTPSGGTWSGPGVVGSDLDPALANIGANSVVYNYTDGFGCAAADSLTINVDVCLGMQTQLASNIQLFPNPNSGTFTLTSDEMIGQYEICDATGRVVYADRSQNKMEVIQIESLSAGIYFVKISGTVVKFVVE